MLSVSLGLLWFRKIFQGRARWRFCVIAALQLPILDIQAKKFRISFRGHLIMKDQSTALISIQPIGTEHLLFKTLMIDRATVHLVNSTWPMDCKSRWSNFSRKITGDQLFGQKFTCVLVTK